MMSGIHWDTHDEYGLHHDTATLRATHTATQYRNVAHMGYIAEYRNVAHMSIAM